LLGATYKAKYLASNAKAKDTASPKTRQVVLQALEANDTSSRTPSAVTASGILRL